MQYDLFRSSRDLGLTWPEVKLWPWPFKVILYMVRRALTRQTRWYQIRCSVFKIKDFNVEKPFWIFFLEFWPLETPILTWAKKMTEMISKWFFAIFRTLPFVFLYGDQEPRSWGGGAFKRPPPPSRRWKIQRPSRARVNIYNMYFSMFYHWHLVMLLLCPPFISQWEYSIIPSFQRMYRGLQLLPLAHVLWRIEK